MKTYTILGFSATMSKKMYENQRIAIQFTDTEDGSIITMATVNLPDVKIEENEITIKDYSENEGILDEMINQGIISKPLRHENTGYVRIPICKLLK